jgi:hypothetical protein
MSLVRGAKIGIYSWSRLNDALDENKAAGQPEKSRENSFLKGV